jgi:hypothetical protein
MQWPLGFVAFLFDRAAQRGGRDTRRRHRPEGVVKNTTKPLLHGHTAALFILMETLENSTDSIAFASRAKYVAFSHCGELHVYEMIDTQVAELESAALRIDFFRLRITFNCPQIIRSSSNKPRILVFSSPAVKLYSIIELRVYGWFMVI